VIARAGADVRWRTLTPLRGCSKSPLASPLWMTFHEVEKLTFSGVQCGPLA
jgi:hypothetical protein